MMTIMPPRKNRPGKPRTLDFRKTPDWKSPSLTTGDHIANVPGPLIRMFPRPDGRRRMVDAYIRTWIGLAPGASHHTAILEQEDNPVWDGRNGGTWRVCWDDHFGNVLDDDWYIRDPAPGIESTSLTGSDARGVTIEARCLSREVALAWLKEEFSR